MATVAFATLGIVLLLALARHARPVASSATPAQQATSLPYWTGLAGK
jgi:hypothetical protein